MKFYQACYGKPDNSRWQTFNTSEDLPLPLSGYFDKIGSSCTPDSAGITQTSNTDHQRIFEIRFNPEDNVCSVLTAEYPGNDDQGRAKMFAHAFLFDASEAVSNLNTIVGISDENFKFDVESTKTVPEQLIYNNELTLDLALSNVGLSKEAYRKLIACVYVLLESQTRFPIYIVGQNNTDFVKNCIFCILSALPYPMRTFLQFANANVASLTKSDKSILFVNEAPVNQYFFNIETGETNIDLSIIENYAENFSTYIAFLQLDEIKFNKYCLALNDAITNIGFNRIPEYSDILMSEKFLHSPARLQNNEDNEISVILSEFLRIPYQNLYTDNFIAEIMKIYDSKNILPNDDLIYKMEVKNENTQSADFVEYYKRIRMRYLLSRNSDEIVNFLTKQYSSKSIFDDWCFSMAQLPGGKEAISLFFEKRFLSRTSWSDIIKTYENAGEYVNYENVQQAIKTQCANIADKLLIATEIAKRDYNDVFDAYRSTTNMVLADCRTFNSAQELEEIKLRFWRRFSFTDFAFDSLCIENCKLLSVIGSPACDNADALILLYDSIEQYKQDSNYTNVENALQTAENILNLTDTELDAVVAKVQKLVIVSLKREAYRHFIFWHKLARFGGRKVNTIVVMAKWKLPVVCREEYFENALKESSRMQANAEAIFKLLVGEDQKGGAVAKFASDPEMVKALKKDAKIISDFLKRAEKDKKAGEKERAKQEKEQAKREKQVKKDEPEEDIVTESPSTPLSGNSETEAANDPTPKKKSIFDIFKKKK